ncbi:MAG: hypothetical protein Q7W29_14500 [bacterium]|nr:hypothetical protein [bacterium]
MHIEPRAGLRAAATTVVALLLLSSVPVALSQQSAPDWRPVNIVYIGDVHGKFEPCG